jgi:hypothetical protein
MRKKALLPKDLVNRNDKILTLDQESVVAPRLFCPSVIRPYDAYALSSGGVFELARFEKSFSVLN